MPKVILPCEECEAGPDRTIIRRANAVRCQILRHCDHTDIGIEGSRRMCSL